MVAASYLQHEVMGRISTGIEAMMGCNVRDEQIEGVIAQRDAPTIGRRDLLMRGDNQIVLVDEVDTTIPLVDEIPSGECIETNRAVACLCF